MKTFTDDNTDGQFTAQQLVKMNERYEAAISELDENDYNYENECQHIAEKIITG